MPGLMVCDTKEYSNAHQRDSGGVSICEIVTVFLVVPARDDPAFALVQGSVSVVFSSENVSALDNGPLGESGLPDILLLE